MTGAFETCLQLAQLDRIVSSPHAAALAGNYAGLPLAGPPTGPVEAPASAPVADSSV
ncbi:hypothetical protein ACIQ7D_11930 [Streptomyces sp. NPDC096310]|uniref:hypothetical protein n=1 Tax=Streptomyces sp. NPDC096310 TaxID=3366082 RepID=UPI0037FEEB11